MRMDLFNPSSLCVTLHHFYLYPFAWVGWVPTVQVYLMIFLGFNRPRYWWRVHVFYKRSIKMLIPPGAEQFCDAICFLRPRILLQSSLSSSAYFARVYVGPSSNDDLVWHSSLSMGDQMTWYRPNWAAGTDHTPSSFQPLPRCWAHLLVLLLLRGCAMAIGLVGDG